MFLPTSIYEPTPSTVDVSTHRSCNRCARRMSSLNMTDILFVYNVGLFSVHLMLGALSAALGHLNLCRIIFNIRSFLL